MDRSLSPDRRADLVFEQLALDEKISTGNRSACGAAVERPNVVIILADDLGWGDPACYNPESRIPTPVIDRLAREGMRFTDAHAPAALCTPSRYALLTGRYCWRSRLKRGVLDGYSPMLIEPGRPTLASFVKAKGYATACIGKWHLGIGESGRTDYAKKLQPGPLSAGFETYFGIPASLDMPPYLYIENDGPLEPPTGTIGESQMRRYGGQGYWRAGAIAPGFRHQDVLPRLTDRAVEWVRKQSTDRPFFLYFALNSPHTPWMPTPEFRGKSGADWYGDYTVETDAMVGRVVEALNEKGFAKNTLLFFASDNGAHWLPTDIDKWNHRANGPWRGQKSDVWEGGHRVPFIARWPGRIPPGSTCSQTVCHADLFATVAELLGEPLPESGAEDSFSILPLLRGRTDRPVRASLVHHSGDGLFAIRAGSLKLVEGLGSGGFTPPKHEDPQPGGPQGQLYDLATDPAEKHNLWLERPAEVARLQGLLESIRAQGRSRQ
jgi:arylsulfatase A-like enzyme